MLRFAARRVTTRLTFGLSIDDLTAAAGVALAAALVALVPLVAAPCAVTPPGGAFALPGLVLEPQLPSELPVDFSLSEGTSLRLVAGTNVGGLFGIRIRPDDVSIKYPFAPGTQPPQAGVGVSFVSVGPGREQTVVLPRAA